MKVLKYEAPKVEIIEVAVEKGYAATTGLFSIGEEDQIKVVEEDEGSTWGDLWGGKIH